MTVRLDFTLGCTASGKGGLAHHLARCLDAEIISVDITRVPLKFPIISFIAIGYIFICVSWPRCTLTSFRSGHITAVRQNDV